MVSLICSLTDHRDDVNCCAFSAAMLATCSGDKTIRIYNTKDFSELAFSPLSGHGYSVHSCCFSPCGELLASCSTDATTVVWSMATGDIEAVLEHPGRSPVRVCVFFPDSTRLVSGASDGSLALWDVPTKILQRTTGKMSESAMVACSVSPCGQMFMTGSTYGDLRLFNHHMQQVLSEKNAHDLGVACCNFAPIILNVNQSVHLRLASCGQDGNVKIWAITKSQSRGCKMQLLYTLTGQTAPVLACAFSSDGRLLASGSVDKTVTVYDAKNGVLLYKMHNHERYVTACAFSPNSPLLATGSMDKTVNIWRLKKENCQNTGKLTPDVPEEGASTSSTGRSLARPSWVSDWSEDDVSAWLVNEGLEELVNKFRANNIDGTELLNLTKDTLESDLQIASLGLRSKVLRKIEELKGASVCTGIPDEFLCPITRELMKEPVIAADGFSYEKDAIESWIQTKNRSSPMTNMPLKTTVLIPNHTLKMAIGRWRTSH